MKMDYITFRSITPAQRGQRLLRQYGIETLLQRTPRWMEERGCSYCLRLRQADTGRAEQLLRSHDALFNKVYFAGAEDTAP
ncbi:MAG: DUF3343 domain-containing protein [Oscillospiraceae bacterium]|nr:DUF3343 domain-containing protein [Oscillospiraceae bacterium]